MPSIPMPILGALVVGGVALVVALTRVLGFSREARLLDLDDARARFLADHPDETIEGGVLADDARSAMLLLEGGRVGALFAVGDRTASRVLAPSLVLDVTTSVDGLSLRLRDPGAPRVVVRLRDPEVTRTWASRLGG